MNGFPIGILGIAAILGIAFLFSANKRAIRLRVVGAAFLLQAGMAVIVLRTPWGIAAIKGMSEGVSALLGYAQAGTNLIFGDLATDPKFGHAFAISALPVIIFFAALVAVLYHLGIMQFIIKWVGGAIEKITGVTKVESLCAAANIFVGQSESPLVIRPYLARLTPPQIFAVMSIGMAGVAGTILAAYASLLGAGYLPYLLAASFMAAPGGLLMAKIIMPDDLSPKDGELPLADGAAEEEQVIRSADHDLEEEKAANIIMAASNGALTGVKIAVAVGAMVLAFVSLVALANGLLGGVGHALVWVAQQISPAAGAWAQTWLGDLSFQKIVGSIFAPVMWLMGIPAQDMQAAGGLFGTKVVLNEFVAFIDLGNMSYLPLRTTAIVTFALCGFANFSSIAIQMASTGSLAPNQRPTIARLGLRALLAGSLANLMSAVLAGLLLTDPMLGVWQGKICEASAKRCTDQMISLTVTPRPGESQYRVTINHLAGGKTTTLGAFDGEYSRRTGALQGRSHGGDGREIRWSFKVVGGKLSTQLRLAGDHLDGVVDAARATN